MHLGRPTVGVAAAAVLLGLCGGGAAADAAAAEDKGNYLCEDWAAPWRTPCAPPIDGWEPKWDEPERGATFPIMAWWPPTFEQLGAYTVRGHPRCRKKSGRGPRAAAGTRRRRPAAAGRRRISTTETGESLTG